MGSVLHFWSSGLKPKTRGSIRSPRRDEKRRKCSVGIEPRDFQLETACRLTPATEAAALIPPMASITASTVSNMEPNKSQDVIAVKSHEMEIADGEFVMPNPVMDDREMIRQRLEALEAATMGTDTGARKAFAKSIRISPHGWSQFVTGKRDLTLRAADKICDRWGVSLDWLYRGNAAAMPRNLAHLADMELQPIRKRA